MTKYSIKNISLGIGIGLIIASVANISTTSTSLTEDEIRREAAKRNLIVMNAKDLIQKQPEQVKQNQEQAKPVEPKTPEKQEQTMVIVIESGTTSQGIAELLLSNKLIESKQTFLDRLSELKKESKLQIGTFKIPAGSSTDRIIEIITSTPK